MNVFGDNIELFITAPTNFAFLHHGHFTFSLSLNVSHGKWLSFIILYYYYYFKHNSNLDMSSSWHLEVKFINRRLTKVSAADHWV
jgi:hypothetical protein